MEIQEIAETENFSKIRKFVISRIEDPRKFGNLKMIEWFSYMWKFECSRIQKTFLKKFHVDERHS